MELSGSILKKKQQIGELSASRRYYSTETRRAGSDLQTSHAEDTLTDPTPTASPDRLAAHDLLSELRTRVANQPLPYQHGIEAAALKSLWAIFDLARKAMKDHPGCADFARITTNMLNVDLRPVTAKWHRAYEAGVLDSRDGANEFRADLAKVRLRLIDFAKDLQVMAYGTATADAVTPDVLDPEEIAECFAALHFGVDRSTETGRLIFEQEAQEIAARRAAIDVSPDAGLDAVGLALSGGGIRSATFCLGVVQVLAERGLMKHFDYLSTVSGGGYTGAFISSLIGSGEGFQKIAKPFGPDTDPIRHVRQNAKYLSAIDLKLRWTMITGTAAGLLLNWTAPLAALSLLALVASIVPLDYQSWAGAAVFFAVLTLVAIFVYGMSLNFSSGRWTRGTVSASAAVALFCSAMIFVEWGFNWFQATDHVLPVSLAALWAVAGPAAARFLPVFRTEKYRRLLFRITLYAAGLIVPLLAVLVFYALRNLAGRHLDTGEPWWNPLHYADGSILLWAILGVSGLFSFFLLNVNLTGPHKLYRDQLARTFIWPSGAAEISMARMNENYTAPYHLINATVNLPSSASPVLRDRKGDFFLFSKLWTGSSAVGYTPTRCWATRRRPIDLASAMAISGAAASPQMGLGSFPTLSALMTLLNIRLGFWVANPRGVQSLGPPGFSCILKEMTGTFMSEHETWLNVSDGGHIENMGLYELLRRRCKFIVCVDGEADPESTFHGQLTLVRHAQIDFGIRIEPRLDDMRPNPKSRLSKTHAQLFRIRYPATTEGREAGLGLMLYMKLSLTGDEAELLKRYYLVHPDFPHQSTIDQFYDEEQFEAYRQLGVHVAEGTFAPALMTANPHPGDVRGWFAQLASNMLEPSGCRKNDRFEPARVVMGQPT
jgi:hypothetical protein